MSKCPSQKTVENCGLFAAQWLVENELMVIDPLQSRVPIVDKRGAPAFNLLRGKDIYSQGTSDIALFGCIACSGCIEVEDNLGTFSVTKLS